MASAPSRAITAIKITPESYRTYGDVIAADDALPFTPANFGTAKRFNFLAELANLRGENARANMCVFRCSAFVEPQLTVNVLEKHPFSTQVFLPLHSGRYVTVVALGGEQPDLNTLAAFVVEGPQGITYRPGIWHYPMTALGEALDLACLVWEDGTKGDCLIATLPEPIVITL